MKTIKAFKFITSDMKSKNGDHVWEIGKWYKYEGKLELCNKGFHACLTPQQSLDYIYGDKWFIIEARGNIIYVEKYRDETDEEFELRKYKENKKQTEKLKKLETKKQKEMQLLNKLKQKIIHLRLADLGYEMRAAEAAGDKASIGVLAARFNELTQALVKIHNF